MAKDYAWRFQRGDWKKAMHDGFILPYGEGRLSPLERAMRAVRDFEGHLLTSAPVAAFVEAGIHRMDRTDERHCPASPASELVKFLASRRGDIDQSRAQVMTRFCRLYMAPVARYRKRVVIEALRATKELPLVAAGLACAEAADTLWLAWMKDYAAPHADLPQDERESFVWAWKNVLNAYDYSVVNAFGERVTWRKAFPSQVGQLTKALGMLGLAFAERHEQAVVDYLLALIDAYQCTDVETLDAMWCAVDEAWIRIPPGSEFVPVHGMENYEHPFGVSPEFRLCWRATTPEMQRQLDDVRQSAVDYAGCAPLLGQEARESARHALANVDAAVYFPVADGGSALCHRIAGQVVPNRTEARDKGAKVFISDAENAEGYAALYRKTLEAHCRPDVAAVLAPLITVEQMTYHTVGHEFFHPMGCTEAVNAGLGEAKKLLEETKATFGGITLYYPNLASTELRLGAFAVSLARALRFVHKSRLENPSVLPYVRENLTMLYSFICAGAVRMSPSGVDVRFEQGNVDTWYGWVRTVRDAILRRYGDHDAAGLAQMTALWCGADDRGGNEHARAIVRWVNRAQKE